MALAIQDSRNGHQELALRQILVAVDDSHESRRAIQVAALLARQARADVVVVHFREVGDSRKRVFLSETIEEATRLLREAVCTFEAAGLSVRAEQRVVPLGSRGAHIQEFADSINADLIVMGTRGLGVVGALFMGSVTHQVIRGARRPVLLVP